MVTKKLPTPRKTHMRPRGKNIDMNTEEALKLMKKAKKVLEKKKVFGLDILVSNTPPKQRLPIMTVHIYDGDFHVEVKDDNLSVAKILTMVVNTVPMAIRDIIQRRIPDNNPIIESMLTRASAHTLRTGRSY